MSNTVLFFVLLLSTSIYHSRSYSNINDRKWFEECIANNFSNTLTSQELAERKKIFNKNMMLKRRDKNVTESELEEYAKKACLTEEERSTNNTDDENTPPRNGSNLG